MPEVHSVVEAAPCPQEAPRPMGNAKKNHSNTEKPGGLPVNCRGGRSQGMLPGGRGDIELGLGQ